jgi:eukaryotic-like serine/threonine-protein kinase
VVGELVLGRFLVEQRLGSGGYGTVYRAWDGRLERDVAVKVIEGESGAGARVVREAQAAARLSHPGIVTLYELGEEEGRAFLVSELVDGETLRELSLAGGLSDRELGEIGAELCEALDHAHHRGVVHRDIKPQNILVCDPGRGWRARLMDFGIARITDGAALTATGTVVGTLAYMAPEQAEGRAAGPEADVYALALTLYECWSGENPHRRATPAATARAIGSQLPSLQRLRPDLPLDLVDGIDACLDPDPRQRPALEELGQAIEASLDDLEERRAPPARPEPGAAQAAAGVWERRPGTIVCAAVLAGLVATASLAGGGRGFTAAIVLAPLVGVLTLLRARLGYLAAALGLAAWFAFAAGRPGVALVLAAVTIPPVLALRDAGRVLVLPAAAPPLGVFGLAPAFAILAAFAERWRERALVSATGFVWLVVAEILLDRDLGFGVAVRPAPGWQESPSSALTEVLVPLALEPRFLAGAAVWSLAAVLVGALVGPLRGWVGARGGAPRRPLRRRIAAPAAAGGGGGRQAALP